MTAPTEDLIARADMIVADLEGLPHVTESVREVSDRLRALQAEVEELRVLHQKVMRRSTRDGMGGKVGDLLDNQAWIVLSHVASQLSDHWNDPNLMEKWQDAWADGEVQKGYFTPHRGVAAWISRAVIARSALTGSAPE